MAEILRTKTEGLFNNCKYPCSVVKRKNSELNVAEMRERKTWLISYPQRVVLELTNRCNMNCVMCGRNSIPFEFHDLSIPFNSLDPVLTMVEEVALMGWGEPMVHPKFESWLEYVNRFDVRIYLITNGLKLPELLKLLEKYRVDILAVSLDGATAETNNRIRRGSDFNSIATNLTELKEMPGAPYVNLVFTAMKSNIHELPQLVEVAATCGIDEVKVVYLTSFKDTMIHESLWNEQKTVSKFFDEAADVANLSGVLLKLPYIQGHDPAGISTHKACYTAWRDLYIGCDGNIRTCQSSGIKLGAYNGEQFHDIWNSLAFRTVRDNINFKLCSHCYQSSWANWNMKHAWFNRSD